MAAEALEVPGAEILPWREDFRREMDCQIVQDSFHARPGWTRSFLLRQDGMPAGYGAAVVGGPWRGQCVVFEFYLAPACRDQPEPLFRSLLAASGASGLRVQTNDLLFTRQFEVHAGPVTREKIIFADAATTALPAPAGTALVRLPPENRPVPPDPEWGLERAREIVGRGGVLWHYNRPYGDLFMEVAEAHRRQGLGAYLVQELKRICRDAGGIPAARCSPDNRASQHALLKAGFRPCADLLEAPLR